jgi:histidinol phosphatase-like PHP family hydrolase
MNTTRISRREFVGGAAAVGLLGAVTPSLWGAPVAESPPESGGIPLVDYHVHCDKPTTLEKLMEISKQRGVKFGIVEHAGTKEQKYPRVLSSDEDLKQYLAELEGTPFYRGIQAEYNDWMGCFSKAMIAKLDYVLTDAMTFRNKDGRPVRLWDAKFTIDDPQDFMDRYVDYHLEVISLEPIDILANPTYLPPAIARQYDALWTPPRMRKIIDAAVKHQVAFEINSGSRLPRLAFLRLAKEAGARFSFGSNIRGPNVGKLDYCLEMVEALGLTRKEIFTPAPPGQKPVELRKPAGGGRNR